MHIKDCNASDNHTHVIVDTFFGVDNSQNLYADVHIKTCKKCHRIWIWYLIETECHTSAGKWFLGEITQSQLNSLTLNNVIELLESLPSITYGGGYFNGVVKQHTGDILSHYARTNTPN